MGSLRASTVRPDVPAWSRVALVTACLGVLPGSARAAAPPQPVAGWEAVARTVRDRLREDPTLAHDQIGVDASGLLITLTGTVGSHKERRRALEIARADAPPHTMINDTLQVVSSEPPPAGPSRAASYRFWNGSTPPTRPTPPTRR